MSILNNLIDEAVKTDHNKPKLTEGFREDLNKFASMENKKLRERESIGIPRAIDSLNTALDSVKVARNSISSSHPNYRLAEASISSIEKVLDVLSSFK